MDTKHEALELAQGELEAANARKSHPLFLVLQIQKRYRALLTKKE